MNANMKKAREAAGFSQKQVSLTLGVSAPTVSDWEAGKINPTVENLKRLSQLYKVPTDYLLGQTDDDRYIEPNQNKLRTGNPISILSCLYHVSSDVLSSISGAGRETVERWIDNLERPSDSEYAALAEFFELPVDELKAGVLPLFPKESVQLRVLELTNVRFAAYGRENEDFSQEELNAIDSFIAYLKGKRGSTPE